MKCIRKCVILVLLYSLFMPLIMGSATNEIASDRSSTASAESSEYTASALGVPVADESLSHRDIFNNTPPLFADTVQTRTTTNFVQFENGFLYEDGHHVKTKGQVDVPAYLAVTDFTEEEKMYESILMQEEFSEIEILADPTSAYNCHAYAWCETPVSNPYWINDVDSFISDIHTEYITDTRNVENARVGDIAVYFNLYDEPVHSAIITEISENSLICVSKWGASVLCEHELSYVPKTYWYTSTTYYCRIYRISQHAWSYATSVSYQHTRTCTICDYELTEECVYSITYNNNGTHTATCTTCGHTSTESCTLQYINADTTRHLVKCTKCNYQRSEVCDLTYTTNDDGTHKCVCNSCGNNYTRACGYTSVHQEPSQHERTCVYCEYSYIEDCYSVNTYCGDGNTEHIHKKVCETCDHVTEGTSETCTFAYKSNGENTHVYACTQCRYVKSGPVACMFKSGKCLICGALKNSAILNAQEEAFSEN